MRGLRQGGSGARTSSDENPAELPETRREVLDLDRIALPVVQTRDQYRVGQVLLARARPASSIEKKPYPLAVAGTEQRTENRSPSKRGSIARHNHPAVDERPTQKRRSGRLEVLAIIHPRSPEDPGDATAYPGAHVGDAAAATVHRIAVAHLTAAPRPRLRQRRIRLLRHRDKHRHPALNGCSRMNASTADPCPCRRACLKTIFPPCRQ